MHKRVKLALGVSDKFVNIYPEVAEITDAAVIRDFDRIPEETHTIERIAHLNGFINREFDDLVTDEILMKLNEQGINFLSFDLGPSCISAKIDDFYVPVGRVLSPDEILKAGKEKMKRIRSLYNGLISLENLDYHPGGAYEHVCHPRFIKHAIEELDTAFTADIGHINVSCLQLDLDPKDYIASLPMDRLEEVHISHAEGDCDAHGVPSEDDYALFNYICSIKMPEFVTLEIMGNPEIVIREIKRLHNYLGAANLITMK